VYDEHFINQLAVGSVHTLNLKSNARPRPFFSMPLGLALDLTQLYYLFFHSHVTWWPCTGGNLYLGGLTSLTLCFLISNLLWLRFILFFVLYLLFWISFFWHRKQDIELMHMRYALESTVLALGAMERSMSGEIEIHQDVPLFHLKDLQNHLDAISNLPRKVSHFSFFFFGLNTLFSKW